MYLRLRLEGDDTMELATVDQYQALIEHSSDVITLVDRDGVIQFQSPSIERILGYDPDELVGKHLFEYVHPADQSRAREGFEAFAASSDSVVDDVEFRFQHANGSWVWLESIASNRPNSALEGFVVNSRDITDWKADQERLATLTEELELLNRVVRHDIRNDMNIVMGWAQLLEENVNDDGQDALRKIMASGEHIIELTDIARDFVASLTGDGEIETKPVSIRSTIQTEMDLRREAYPGATFIDEGDIPEVAVVANDMLSSVFRNLLNNAVQHNDTESPVVTVSGEMRGDKVVISVADNGPGIPDDQKESIFGKGEKGLGSSGTGIGLYLVQSLLEQYDGSIWIEDNDPTGAVFKAQLQKFE